jgi:hypothetical protein
MYFTLRMFRVLFLGFIILLSLSSLGISSYLGQHFEEKTALIVLILLPLTTIFGALWSIYRRRLMAVHHTVLCELLLAFSCTPCHLVLSLYVLTLQKMVPERDRQVILALEIIVYITAAAVMLYGLGLLTTALFTLANFDAHVWTRDIDASPSPFPARVAFAPVLKWFGVIPPSSSPNRTGSAQAGSPNMMMLHSAICSSNGGNSCSCHLASKGTLLPDHLPAENESKADHLGRTLLPRSGSSVLDLVRVPDAVQKRSSIAVAFEV